jgi:hypothetical protein
MITIKMILNITHYKEQRLYNTIIESIGDSLMNKYKVDLREYKGIIALLVLVALMLLIAIYIHNPDVIFPEIAGANPVAGYCSDFTQGTSALRHYAQGIRRRVLCGSSIGRYYSPRCSSPGSYERIGHNC